MDKRPKLKRGRPAALTSGRPTAVRPVLAILACFGLAGGCTCEGGKVMEAAKGFMAFSEGDPKVTDPLGQKEKKEYTVRHWKEEFVNNRHRALADLEVDVRIEAKKLEDLLRDAVHDETLQRSTSAVMVRAWPGKLQKTIAPLGIGIFARDGHGWEGTGVGFEKIHVFIPPPATAKQKNIQPLSESEYLMVLGVENMLQRGQDLEQSQKLTAERHEVAVEKIKAACERASRIKAYLEKGVHAAVGPTALR